jgi:hypothetical protein
MQQQTSTTMTRLRLRFLIWIVSMAPSIAFGHLIEVGHGAINHVGDKVYRLICICLDPSLTSTYHCV